MRARLALRFAGIEVSVQEIELRNRPPELYAVSPKATVPVLVLDDGTVIDDLSMRCPSTTLKVPRA